MKKRVMAGVIAGIILVSAGIFASVYQPAEKTDEIYKAAMQDFKDGNYQNAYYLFSKITLF